MQQHVRAAEAPRGVRERRRAAEEGVARVERAAQATEPLAVLALRCARQVAQEAEQRLEAGIEDEVVDLEDGRRALAPDRGEERLDARVPLQAEEHHDRVRGQRREQPRIADVHDVGGDAVGAQLLGTVRTTVPIRCAPVVGHPQHAQRARRRMRRGIAGGRDVGRERNLNGGTLHYPSGWLAERVHPCHPGWPPFTRSRARGRAAAPSVRRASRSRCGRPRAPAPGSRRPPSRKRGSRTRCMLSSAARRSRAGA